MSHDNKLKILRESLSELFGLDRFNDIALDSEAELASELGLSSLDMVALITSLDEAHGLLTPVRQIAITELITIDDITRLIAGKFDQSSSEDPLTKSLERGLKRRRGR